MELQSLQVQTRENEDKMAVRAARKAGRLPAVVYGGEGEPMSVTLDAREFDLLLHGHGGEHAVVQLVVESNDTLSTPALLKDVQHHPLRGQALHADFMRISLDQRINTAVAVSLVGQCPGALEGGVVDHQLREVEVECLALEVPESIELDVSELELGHSLSVAALVAPEGVTIVTPDNRSVVSVRVPRVVKSDEEIAAEAEAEALALAEAEAGEGAEGAEGAEGESAPAESSGSES